LISGWVAVGWRRRLSRLLWPFQGWLPHRQPEALVRKVAAFPFPVALGAPRQVALWARRVKRRRVREFAQAPTWEGLALARI
jgi:hypothetical protein